jgi:hydrogenase maturation factor HypE
MTDEGEHRCPLGWLVEDVGRFLTDADADDAAVVQAGQLAVQQGAAQVNELLRGAFMADEVVATELRLIGPGRGARRTVFADGPTPVALLLLCLRLCDDGDEVAVLHHTAGKGTTTRSAVWPFGMDRAEELTRPPADATAPVPGLEDCFDPRR